MEEGIIIPNEPKSEESRGPMLFKFGQKINIDEIAKTITTASWRG